MIIFDLDGTLWDSTENTAKAWSEEIRREGMDAVMTPEEVAKVMGMTMPEIEKELLGRYGVEIGSDLFLKCMEYENEYLTEHGAILYPGVRETLEKLHQAGHQMAIVTNGQEGYVNAFLKSMNMEKYFCDIEEWGHTLKPKADNIKLVMSRNGVTRAVYVGDIQNDANSSEEAGIPCISAEYGFGHIENPIARMEKFEDLPRILREIGYE